MLVGRHRSCGADSPHDRDASCGTPAYLRNALTAGAQLAGAGHGAVGARVDKTRMDAGNEPDLGLDRIPNEHAAYQRCMPPNTAARTLSLGFMGLVWSASAGRPLAQVIGDTDRAGVYSESRLVWARGTFPNAPRHSSNVLTCAAVGCVGSTRNLLCPRPLGCFFSPHTGGRWLPSARRPLSPCSWVMRRGLAP